MFSYRKKIIIVSIILHVIAISALITYWLFNATVEPPKEVVEQPVNSTKQNTAQPSSAKTPNTGKNPYEDFAEGDLSNQQVKDLLTNSINEKPLNSEEQKKEFDEKFQELDKTPVQEIQKMADLISKSSGVTATKSKLPLREISPGEQLDVNSVRLYNYEVGPEGKFTLIYKDKNNLYFKDGPYKYNELDDATQTHLSLIKRANENKKVRILLDATQNILELLSPVEDIKKE